jgi:AGZA family xanthine/uracil permease-like MFS transporter
LFLIALPFVLLVNWIPAAATAPALIIVGFLMIKSVKDIKFDVIEEGIPAFLTIVTMVFTFSIAKGIGAGFIAYCLIKLFTGKWKEVHPIMWALGIIFALYFIFVAGII